MNVAHVPSTAVVPPTHDCETEDRIHARAAKLDMHAKEIIEALAQRVYEKRKQAGSQDVRSEEELALADWLQAEEAFCAALENRWRRECESAGRYPTDKQEDARS